VAFFVFTGQNPPPTWSDTGLDDARRVLDAAPSLRVLRGARRRAISERVCSLLDHDPDARSRIDPEEWARGLTAELLPRRGNTRRQVLLPVAVAAASLTLAAATTAALGSWPFGQDGAARRASATSASPLDPKDVHFFGLEGVGYPHAITGHAIAIDPLTDFNRLRGVDVDANRCSATVDLDVVSAVTAATPTTNFGIAVAPRSVLVDDQPQGASIQYEWEARDMTTAPGSYVRPATLPGGAWVVQQAAVPAPAITRAHHVTVSAVGTRLQISIDGKGTAVFHQQAVECGGVTIRAWGAPVTLKNVAISGV
jgi:hypothetical protein